MYLEYAHIGKCNCGKENHLCSEKCSKEKCENMCNLSCEHKEELHDCKEYHKCFKICSLKAYSKVNTCNNICSLVLGHEGDCICSIEKDKHICDKKCKKCANTCKLSINHEGECLCGKCICDMECIYKNKSHNCKQKCKELFGHEGPHICEEKIHLCSNKCIYETKTRKINGGCLILCAFPVDHDKSITHLCGIDKNKHICSGTCYLFNKNYKNGCGRFCNKSIEHEGPCLCQYSIEKHLCNKECSLNGIKGCKNLCSLPSNHKGNCLCSAGEEGHICDKECSYFQKTRIGCKEKCILKYNHSKNQACICSNTLNKHIHKGECYLKSKTREGCFIQCKLSVNHGGNCICENASNLHICNQPCNLINKSYEGSCHKLCINQADHSGEHICSSIMHECNEPCKYKDRSKKGCLGHCSKEVGHKASFLFNEHLCENNKEKHICNKKCDLKHKSREGCKDICDKPIEHSGIHLCDSNNHICKEKCFYFNKSPKECNQLCAKKVGHPDIHECDIKTHFCKKTCYLNKISRFCNSECSLLCNHKGNCICKKKLKEHICNNKCILCADYCCYEYGHKSHHLCDKEHECNEICNEKGYCEIKTNNILKKVSVLFFEQNQKLEFDINTEQINNRKKCIIKIPKGFIAHKGKHICDINKHKCGYICRQCNRLCELEYGHPSFHYCKHGHIRNSIIQTEEKSLEINYKENKIEIKNEESAIMFTCYEYCKEQRRGHVHRLDYEDILKLNIIFPNEHVRKLNKYIYECKCEFFWKKFMGFCFETEFDEKLREEFERCPSRCGICQKLGDSTFCELELWHKEKDHFFKCLHNKFKPYYTIFLVDKSDSMGSIDIKPSEKKLSKLPDFNNRLGCVIQLMNNYIQKRLDINKEEVFSLVTFNNEATIDIEYYDNDSFLNVDFIEECVNAIGYPKGNSLFKTAFVKAEKILSKLDINEYSPLIILLSDGGDDGKKETIEYVKEVSNILFIIFFVYIAD